MAVRGLLWLFTETPPSRVIFSLIAFMESSDMVLLGLAVFGVLRSSILEDPRVTVFVEPRVTGVVDCFGVPTTTAVGFTAGDEEPSNVFAVGVV